MKIEVVDFYPLKERTKDGIGTLHVFLVDYNIDLRGIFVKKKKKGYFFLLPATKGYDHDLKKEVRYPIINFLDAEKNKSLVSEIAKHGTKFLKEMGVK